MVSSSEKIFSTLGISVIFMNFIFHITNAESLISPSNLPAVMTIYTSISLFSIFMTFITQSKKIQVMYLVFAITVQLTSIFIYRNPVKPAWIFLLSSSIPTSLMIILTSSFIYLSEIKEAKTRMGNFFGPILLIICTLLFFSFISEEFFILGYSQEYIGIGLSPYTLFSFYLIAMLVSIRHTKMISLEILDIKFNPYIPITILSIYALTNFLLLYCTSKNVLITSITVHAIFFILFYYYFLRPFLSLKEKFMTVCAWSQKIKTSSGNWVQQEELLQELGFKISHGISPEEKVKLENLK